jgi:ssRNA-specific RNase YbeY (16S rRNA maturation enzyme)
MSTPAMVPELELALYVVHGVLHLCGFDDRSGPDRARMRRAERTVLASIGVVSATMQQCNNATVQQCNNATM